MTPVLIPGEPSSALRLGRQRADKASDRGFRHNLVFGAIRHQHWRIEAGRGNKGRSFRDPAEVWPSTEPRCALNPESVMSPHVALSLFALDVEPVVRIEFETLRTYLP